MDQTASFCANSDFGGIKCPQSSADGIQFKSAFFGRFNVQTCPHNAINLVGCAVDVLSAYQNGWDGAETAYGLVRESKIDLDTNCLFVCIGIYYILTMNISIQ